ncbi:RNA-directed DNA polymerase, eukaryota, reverse transcriptase zinc-binding domain protein [Tanacetum coccineum]|uniref:RNA-directed DNA polymerase, eukaryota, reverse transcriptase zinc-binding domain protein n=1 Tax=Tanacetum coccineum TaxID=301880 RepID=A0ABQ4WPZ7_9ASTR
MGRSDLAVFKQDYRPEDFQELAWVKFQYLASLDKGGLGVSSLKAFNMLSNTYEVGASLLRNRFSPHSSGIVLPNSIHFKNRYVRRTKAEFDALISKIASLEPEELFDSDTCIWSLSHDDKFLVNSVRKHIDELSLISLSPRPVCEESNLLSTKESPWHTLYLLQLKEAKTNMNGEIGRIGGISDYANSLHHGMRDWKLISEQLPGRSDDAF